MTRKEVDKRSVKGDGDDDGDAVGRATAVTFQEDGRPITTTYLRLLHPLSQSSLSRLSVCFRIHLLQARQEVLIISYAKQSHDNELYVGTLVEAESS